MLCVLCDQFRSARLRPSQCTSVFLLHFSQEGPGAPVEQEVDAALQLQRLVEISQGQERFLTKICTLLEGLSNRVDQIQISQEQLANRMASHVMMPVVCRQLRTFFFPGVSVMARGCCNET